MKSVSLGIVLFERAFPRLQVQSNGEQECSKYFTMYLCCAPPHASRWQKNDDNYQKGLRTVKSSCTSNSRTDGEVWGDNDLTTPVGWENGVGSHDELASSINSSVVHVQQHPDVEEYHNAYERIQYMPTRSYWRVMVTSDNGNNSFDVVTVVSCCIVPPPPWP